MAAEAAVWVLGAVNVDVTLRVHALPVPGATVLATEQERSGGGKGANAAVAAARDGARVRLVGAVGDDAAGRAALSELREEGIDVSRVGTVADTPTGLAMICVDAAGDNQIVVSPGANWEVGAEVAADGLRELDARDVCVVSFEIPEAAVRAAARQARERAARLLVNPSPVRPLCDEMLRAAPVVVANAGEFRELTGQEDRVAGAAALRALGCEATVVTLGGDGAEVTGADGSRVRVSPHDARPVDTTGAGDTFTGVLAAALAAGMPLPAAAARANVAAARATEGFGARTAMPTREETTDVLHRDRMPPRR
jgi:ribokinase